MNRTVAVAACALALATFSLGAYGAPAAPAGHARTHVAAHADAKVIDVGNTKCPVSGKDVGDHTVVYEGHLFHFCCPMCPGDFKKDPSKYIEKMRADPKAYGIKDVSLLPAPKTDADKDKDKDSGK